MIRWRNIWRGLIMGATDLIPGVSGGTIALLLGIYRDLIGSINRLFSREWKRSLAFLFPLGIGIVVALLAGSGLIEWLLETHPHPTFSFFLGLVIGIIPSLLRVIDFRNTFRSNHYLLLLLITVLVALTQFGRDDTGIGSVMEHIGLLQYIWLFSAGWLASMAMILPGISGSFVFLLMGVFPTVIHALSTINLQVIAIVGFGIVIGLLISSKIIAYLLERYTVITFAAIIGLVTGSVFIIFPGVPQTLPALITAVFCFAIGFVISIFLGRFQQEGEE